MNAVYCPTSETKISASLNSLDLVNDGQTSAADVYLSIAGEQLGPYCLSRALTLVRRNRLEAKAWFWRAGMAEWKKLSEYLRIRSSIHSRRAGRAR